MKEQAKIRARNVQRKPRKLTESDGMFWCSCISKVKIFFPVFLVPGVDCITHDRELVCSERTSDKKTCRNVQKRNAYQMIVHFSEARKKAAGSSHYCCSRYPLVSSCERQRIENPLHPCPSSAFAQQHSDARSSTCCQRQLGCYSNE